MRIVCPSCRDETREVKRGSGFFPFCSQACRDRDLGNWITERYKVDGGPVSVEGEAPDLDSDSPEEH